MAAALQSLGEFIQNRCVNSAVEIRLAALHMEKLSPWAYLGCRACDFPAWDCVVRMYYGGWVESWLVQYPDTSRLDTKFLGLSSSMLCEMLKMSQSAPCRAADCGCLFFREEGCYNHHRCFARNCAGFQELYMEVMLYIRNCQIWCNNQLQSANLFVCTRDYSQRYGLMITWPSYYMSVRPRHCIVL